jgi:hypothetical protein
MMVKKGIKVIPCYYKKDYPEWSDRGEGSAAPIAVHLPNSPVIATGKREKDLKLDYLMVTI